MCYIFSDDLTVFLVLTNYYSLKYDIVVCPLSPYYVVLYCCPIVMLRILMRLFVALSYPLSHLGLRELAAQLTVLLEKIKISVGNCLLCHIVILVDDKCIYRFNAPL